MTASVSSRDGTTVAFTSSGAGPPLVLVGGGLDDGTENAFFTPAADALAAALPTARRLVLDHPGHVADPAILAPALRRFYLS
ncbi:hypothetical protein DFJ67_7906 [Asanoa ferruginea]|uniref:Alpha/beta hydrolase family protein n=1 Tax=Asanoa ferruginea TaxID=53367 RepID=A0A3D9ZX89_9ACTN|nr:hypothetical protein [Asanoa ferruginea]REG01817.1 hypothetical protein DFJ67_7906 [Asanoa ferruginea]GIF50305.1 hypothetical protein Afe04nite_48440 [Asanoa ferruginea]